MKIGSVAGPADEATVEACGEAGVPIIRIMAGIDMEIGYLATGKTGITSWPTVADELNRRRHTGDVCLTAEYSNPDAKGGFRGSAVDPLMAEDLAYAKLLFS